MKAIILAGNQSIKKWDDIGNKALLRINGKTMVEYVIDAIKEADGIDRVVVVGPFNELHNQLGGKVDRIIDTAGSIMDNVMAGIKYLGYEDKILICSCDIPLITSEAINDFISRSQITDADLCYPIVEKNVNEAKYPEMERTYVRIKEGTFTGGNIFLVNPKIVEKGFALAERLLEYRKKPLKMARLLGIRFVIELMLGTLSICKVEKRFSELLGITGRAIISEYPEVGHDVDKPSDVIIATAHLSK